MAASSDFTFYNWSTGEDSPSIEIAQAGTYILEFQDDFLCNAEDTITLSLIDCELRIDSPLVGFNVYPNPNNGLFQLRMRGLEGDNFQIEIADPLAKFSCEIDLRGFAQGLYILSITSEEQSICQRFIIQN